MPSQVIYSKQVFTGDTFTDASLIIQDGIILDILAGKQELASCDFIEYPDAVIFPGVIDAHIHINEPGRTNWEGFDTATQAAAAGGITSIIDMPLNSSPVTIDADSFEQKVIASQGKLNVNCGFWGGLVPQNAADLSSLLDTGVLGIKAFLTHSGIDEFPNVTEADLNLAMPQIAEAQIPLLTHCEIDSYHRGVDIHKQYPKSYKHFVASRPPSWENEAARMMIRLCRKFSCPVHIVHLSSAEVLDDIRQAKQEGLPLTVEACPHYLYFDEESIPDADTRFKCTPPIRSKQNNDKLWQALEEGTIDFVASDHSPAPAQMKEAETGNLARAWGGIIGGQLLLSASWTKARNRGIALKEIAKWFCQNPAKFIGLAHTKGYIKKGYDADLVVWNPEASFKVKSSDLLHRHSYSPYVGEELFGDIIATYCNGKLVYGGGKIRHSNQGKKLFRN